MPLLLQRSLTSTPAPGTARHSRQTSPSWRFRRPSSAESLVFPNSQSPTESTSPIRHAISGKGYPGGLVWRLGTILGRAALLLGLSVTLVGSCGGRGAKKNAPALEPSLRTTPHEPRAQAGRFCGTLGARPTEGPADSEEARGYNRVCGICHGINPTDRLESFVIDVLPHEPLDDLMREIDKAPPSATEREGILRFLATLPIRLSSK